MDISEATAERSPFRQAPRPDEEAFMAPLMTKVPELDFAPERRNSEKR